MIKAIIFDCFGLLYLPSGKTILEMFPEHFLELSDLRRQADYGIIDSKVFTKKAASITQISVDEMSNILIKPHCLNRPVIEYIFQELKSKYTIGLLSNVGRGWIENFFSQNQLHEFFDAVVLSGDEGIAKPHPRIFELMAERLGVTPEECIMIDDLPENIAGADAAGMKGIVYSNLRDMKIELQEMLDAGTT